MDNRTRYYATIRREPETTSGQTVTRNMSSNVGIECHVRGWDVGVMVRVHPSEDKDRDVFQIFVTGGSNNLAGRLVGTVTVVAGDVEFIPYQEIPL